VQAPRNKTCSNFLQKILGYAPKDENGEKERDIIKKEKCSLFAPFSLSWRCGTGGSWTHLWSGHSNFTVSQMFAEQVENLLGKQGQ